MAFRSSVTGWHTYHPIARKGHIYLACGGILSRVGNIDHDINRQSLFLHRISVGIVRVCLPSVRRILLSTLSASGAMGLTNASCKRQHRWCHLTHFCQSWCQTWGLGMFTTKMKSWLCSGGVRWTGRFCRSTLNNRARDDSDATSMAQMTEASFHSLAWFLYHVTWTSAFNWSSHIPVVDESVPWPVSTLGYVTAVSRFEFNVVVHRSLYPMRTDDIYSYPSRERCVT